MKKLYLTFDDGPGEYTEELLDLLKEYEISAAFFLVGAFAKERPELVQRMKAEGHLIGVHSDTHKSAYLMGRKAFRRDLERAVKDIEEAGAVPCRYRPPYGHRKPYTEHVAKDMGLPMILWDVMAQDWRGHTTVETISAKILRRSFNGAVLCLHDNRGRNHAPQRTIEALRRTIPVLLERGYTFERIA